MKYTATIQVSGDPDELAELFAPELNRAGHDRAKVTLVSQEDGAVFTVEAKDSVALRAHLLGITKLLTVHEEMGRTG